MMRKTIYLLTEDSGFFGQRMMPWESIDTDILLKKLEEDFEVKFETYEALACGKADLKGAMVIHCSSQQPEYKEYVDDVLLYLSAQGNTLVPSIHTVRSHENKGYQELHRRLVGLESLNPVYLCKRSEKYEDQMNFPAVFKELSGFGSTGVCLVNSRTALDGLTTPPALYSPRRLPWLFRRKLGHFVRKYILLRKNLDPFGDYYKPLKRFVLQRLIPNLSCDLKVLVFQNRIFVLQRDVRQGDFRASGSGMFEFIEAAPELLSYSKDLLDRFGEPYMSFDVCFDGNEYHLIEFQGVHFGPYTVTKSTFHYQSDGENWNKVEGQVLFDDIVAESLQLYLKNKVESGI